MNVRIFKRVAGAFTNIGSTADIAWARGTSKTIRFQVQGTELTAYVDGGLVATATDSSITGVGVLGFGIQAGGSSQSIRRYGGMI